MSSRPFAGSICPESPLATEKLRHAFDCIRSTFKRSCMMVMTGRAHERPSRTKSNLCVADSRKYGNSWRPGRHKLPKSIRRVHCCSIRSTLGWTTTPKTWSGRNSWRPSTASLLRILKQQARALGNRYLSPPPNQSLQNSPESQAPVEISA